MIAYETIKANLIFEEQIFYRISKGELKRLGNTFEDAKQYIGCLSKSKYPDGSDQIQLSLFENKTRKNLVVQLDLINYEK